MEIKSKKLSLDIFGIILILLTIFGFIWYYAGLGNDSIGLSIIGLGGIFTIVVASWRISISVSDSRRREEKLEIKELIMNIFWSLCILILLAYDLYILFGLLAFR